jgi:hypothetical protein
MNFRMLALVGIAALPAEKCDGDYTGPPTTACPNGTIVVVRNGNVTDLKCAASPAPSPSIQLPSSPGPSPTPTPSPSPAASASPAPSPTPSPTPTASPGPNLPVPPVGTCPTEFDHLPTRVGLGDSPAPVSHQGPRSIFGLQATPRDNAPFCGHDTHGRLVDCEQWASCAKAQDRRGEPPLWWFAQYPGTSCTMASWNDQGQCGVDHPTRPCDPSEKAEDASRGLDPALCGRPNGFTGRDIVGTGGGPPGVRTVCTAPHGRPQNPTCRTWDLQLGSWKLLP